MSMVCSSKVDDLCRLKVAPEPVPAARLVPNSPTLAGAAPAHTSIKSASNSIESTAQPASDGSAGNVSTQPTEVTAEDDGPLYDSDYDDTFEHNYPYGDVESGSDRYVILI